MPSKQSSLVTKEKIKDAFLTLYVNNSIDKISIRSISDLAGVNRATFYSHYVDIYDLYTEIIDEKYEIFYAKLAAAVPIAISGGEYRDFIPEEEFFIKNDKWLKILVGTYGKSNIIERLKEDIKGLICASLGFDVDELSPEMAYAMEHMISANAGTFTRWIKNGRDIEIEKLAEIVASSMLKGPLTVLMELQIL